MNAKVLSEKLNSSALLSTLLIILSMFFTACSSSSSGDSSTTIPSTSITISGYVTEVDTNASIKDAQVTLVNMETQESEIDYTNTSGYYSFVVSHGTYEVRIATQGFLASPPSGIVGIPLAETSSFDVSLYPINDGNDYGFLNISLLNYESDVGALVILTSTSTAQFYSATTDINGNIIMYNLLEDDYNLTVKTVGHEIFTAENNVSITVDTQSISDDVELTAIDGLNVSGSITYLAINNDQVDISLSDPLTNKVIPGTHTNENVSTFSIDAVAPGKYYIRATYNIDGLVVDPDAIVKFGEPEVNPLADNITDAHIDVTGAVVLLSPIVGIDGSPVEITTTEPTFTWEAYPSTSDYVVEVLDINGKVVWGGFDAALNKNVTTLDTSITYSNDGNGQVLETGKIYRWKVYASKDDSRSPTGWNLISSSEEAQGVFKIVLP